MKKYDKKAGPAAVDALYCIGKAIWEVEHSLVREDATEEQIKLLKEANDHLMGAYVALTRVATGSE